MMVGTFGSLTICWDVVSSDAGRSLSASSSYYDASGARRHGQCGCESCCWTAMVDVGESVGCIPPPPPQYLLLLISKYWLHLCLYSKALELVGDTTLRCVIYVNSDSEAFASDFNLAATFSPPTPLADVYPPPSRQFGWFLKNIRSSIKVQHESAPLMFLCSTWLHNPHNTQETVKQHNTKEVCSVGIYRCWVFILHPRRSS